MSRAGADTHLRRRPRPVHPRSVGRQGRRGQHAAGQQAQPEACRDSDNGRVSSAHPALPSLPTHTHGSHSDHKGQNDAQREADDVVGDGVHHGPEGLPAGASEDSAVDTLAGERALAGMGRCGQQVLARRFTELSHMLSAPCSVRSGAREPGSPGPARGAQRGCVWSTAQGPPWPPRPRRPRKGVKPETARQLAWETGLTSFRD